MSDIFNPAGTAGAAETTADGNVSATVEQTGATASEFNPDTADNLTAIRDWGKGLKKDLDSVKPAHEFVTSSFGNLENAKLAAEFYGSFAGEQFDPDSFSKFLEQLSPQRSRQLFDKYATGQLAELTQKEVEKIFGGKPSADEIRLFKEFKDNGYGLGKGDDIPEALKFNADGTPKPDEEIAFLRNLQKQVTQSNQTKAAEQAEQEAKEEAARKAAISEAIGSFANDRLKILDSEFKTLGLSDDVSDTADQRAEKQFLRQFLINGISSMYLADESGANDYNAAVKHISNGEGLLARRYEAKIEEGLLKIMRNDYVGRLLKSIATPDPEGDERPEIPNSGGPAADTSNTQGDDLFSRLVREGKIKP